MTKGKPNLAEAVSTEMSAETRNHARYTINLQCLTRAYDGQQPADDARAYARYKISLQWAFDDLLPKLERAYGLPEPRQQDVVALTAVVNFLNRMDRLTFADKFAGISQALQDARDGIRARSLTPAIASRGDPTVVWISRAAVALAVETKRWCGHSRKKAAEWAAKRLPGLKQLIIESGPNTERSKSLEKAIVTWCRDFSRDKVKNEIAARVYSRRLDELKVWASNRNSDQIEGEADRLLQKALQPIGDAPAETTAAPPSGGRTKKFRRNKSGE